MDRHATCKPRSLCLESLDDRLCLAASVGWDGPGQGSADLTYYVANSPPSLSTQQVLSALQTAFAAWSQVADITFTQTNQAGLRDSLDISFVNIDGRGGTLAQAYFPDDVNPARIAGDIRFDRAETWEIGNASRTAFDLVWVAVHEIGHALGLDHSHAAGSVLAATVSPNQAFTRLAAADVDEILALYAPADTGLGEPEEPLDDPLDDQPTSDTPTSDDPPVAEPPAPTPRTTPFRFFFGFRRFRFYFFPRAESPASETRITLQPLSPWAEHDPLAWLRPFARRV